MRKYDNFVILNYEGFKMKNGLLKKGSFIKCGNSVYMIAGILDSDYRNAEAFLGIQVKTKNGRFIFNSKRVKSISQLKEQKGYSYEILNEVIIDKRDQVIFNEFIDYVNNFEFKFESKCQEYNYKKETYYVHWALRIVNGNLKKFKDYSKNI